MNYKEKVFYVALPWLDFYSVVATNISLHCDEITISKEEYEEFLKNNQEKGWAVRGYRKENGSLYVKSVEPQPTLYHYWDVETGSWKEDLELKEKLLTEEYIQKVNSGIEWASSEIDNLQELVDFDDADAEDEAHLLLAKKYRVALNKIKRSLDYPNLEVDLPERPY